jgi:hypothetical protein
MRVITQARRGCHRGVESGSRRRGPQRRPQRILVAYHVNRRADRST